MLWRSGLSGLAGISLMLVAAVPARSELIAVTQIAIGMECQECARKLRIDAKKLEGVDDASTSWNRRILTLRLVPGNTCTLTAVRQLLWQHHFVPGEAEITVVGHVVREQNGRLSLHVRGSNVVFPLDLPADRRFPIDGVSPSTEVVVRGRVAGEATNADARTGTISSLFILELARTVSVRSPAASGKAEPKRISVPEN